MYIYIYAYIHICIYIYIYLDPAPSGFLGGGSLQWALALARATAWSCASEADRAAPKRGVGG